MKVIIMYGGKSGEHEVSLVSATSVVRNINPLHEITLIGITKKGLWYHQDPALVKEIVSNKNATLRITESPEQLVQVIPGGGKNLAITCPATGFITTDIIFPVLHGTYGEDGFIQGLFEMAELPYCGCGVMASSLTMDKEKTKQVWAQEGLPIVPYVAIRKYMKNQFPEEYIQLLAKAETEFGYPLFVKPCCAGSSVGATKARNREELENSIEEAFLWDEKVLVEAFISAREIECSVTGNEFPISYVLGEIAPSHEFYDYEAKYTDPNGAKLIIPASLSAPEREKIKNIAEKAYAVLDCSGLSRVDFFLDKKTNEILLNEINSIPGFTSISMFPKLCQEGGLAYTDLIDSVLQMGIDRYNSRRSLKTSR